MEQNAGLPRTLGQQNHVLNITMPRHFDLACGPAFRASYRDVPATLQTIVLDMRETKTIDAGAFGLLISMSLNVNAAVDIHIVNCGPEVQESFTLFRLTHCFHIEAANSGTEDDVVAVNQS